MTLGIISDCIHYRGEDGSVGTENHILLRQFEALSAYFNQTVICCPFDKMDNSKVLSYYNKPFRFIELPLAGGDTLSDKVKLISLLPKWLKSFSIINKTADIIYQRFPNNLNIPGFFFFYFKKKKVFATYTGTWLDYNDEPSTYRFQKWLLKKYFRGLVWIYTTDVLKAGKFRRGISPSYNEKEWEEETEQVTHRKTTILENGLPVFRLITVGTLISYKNQITILKACVILKERNFSFTLKIVGDGPDYKNLQDFIIENNLHDKVELTGKKTLSELRSMYRQSDFVVQAPLKEGFGKVPVEGFFHGVIPILGNVTLAKFMTGDEERGFLFDPLSAQNLADILFKIEKKIHVLPSIIDNGREFAKSQTLERWASEYYAAVSEYYKET